MTRRTSLRLAVLVLHFVVFHSLHEYKIIIISYFKLPWLFQNTSETLALYTYQIGGEILTVIYQGC